jgi:hypothetical protein
MKSATQDLLYAEAQVLEIVGDQLAEDAAPGSSS